MWCPCLCQLPNRNSRTGKKFEVFFYRIIFSMHDIHIFGLLHTFTLFILYFVSDEKLKFCISAYAEFMLRCLWMIARCHFEMCTRFITQRWRYSRTEDLLWFWLFFIRIETDTFFFWKAFESLVYENILGIWHWMAESALADLPVNLRIWISDIIKISSCQAKSFLSP